MSTPYPGGPPQQWAPPPGPAPAPRSRIGLVLGLLAVGVVLVLVAGVAVVALRGGDDAPADLASGPTSEPEEAWSTDMDLEEDDEVRVVADRDRVYTLVSRLDVEGEAIQGTGTLVAHAADDGEELWTLEVSTPVLAEAPVPLGDAVLVLEQDTEGIDSTRLVDGATGEEIWETHGHPSSGYTTSGPPLSPSILDADPIVFENAGGDDGHVAAVDRETGDVLWEVDDGDGATRPCGDVVVVEDDGDDGEVGDVVARRLDDGDEVWAAEGGLGACDEQVIAVSTATDEVSLLDLGSGDEEVVFDVPDGAEPWRGYPFGDHLAIVRFEISEDGEDSSTASAVYPLGGGDPTWEADDVIAGPIDDERVGALSEDGEMTAIRAEDGEEDGSVRYQTGSACEGFTSVIALGCAQDGDEVTAIAIAGELRELWTVDVGSAIQGTALGGDTVFVVTADGELLALR